MCALCYRLERHAVAIIFKHQQGQRRGVAFAEQHAVGTLWQHCRAF